VTAVEFGTEALGGLGVGAAAKVGGLAFKGTTKKAIQEGLTQKIRSRAARTAGGALSEGLTELGANEGQRSIREGMEATNYLANEDAREKLKVYNDMLDQERGRSNAVSFIAGTGAGGTVSGLGGSLSYAAEVGQQAATTRRRAL